jgi:hypothetical protein
MGAGKRHKVLLELVVTDSEGNETLGGNLRFGQVKQEHLSIYESVIDKHIDNAKAELAQMEAEGKFA